RRLAPGMPGRGAVRTDEPLELLLQEDVTVVRDEPDECRVVLALLNPGVVELLLVKPSKAARTMFSTPRWIHVAPADPVATHSKAPSIAPTTPRLASSSAFSGSMDSVTVPVRLAAAAHHEVEPHVDVGVRGIVHIGLRSTCRHETHFDPAWASRSPGPPSPSRRRCCGSCPRSSIRARSSPLRCG